VLSDRVKCPALAGVAADVGQTVRDVIDVEIAAVRVEKVEEPSAGERDSRPFGNVNGHDSLRYI